MSQPILDFDRAEPFDPKSAVVAPSPHLRARETSALAAVEIQGVRGKQNTELLALITASGMDGMSDREIQQATGWPRQTICVRRFDLRAFLTVGTRRDTSTSGRAMTCWRRKTAAELAS
jgi:hypothetical protein